MSSADIVIPETPPEKVNSNVIGGTPGHIDRINKESLSSQQHNTKKNGKNNDDKNEKSTESTQSTQNNKNENNNNNKNIKNNNDNIDNKINDTGNNVGLLNLQEIITNNEQNTINEKSENDQKDTTNNNNDDIEPKHLNFNDVSPPTLNEKIQQTTETHQKQTSNDEEIVFDVNDLDKLTNKCTTYINKYINKIDENKNILYNDFVTSANTKTKLGDVSRKLLKLMSQCVYACSQYEELFSNLPSVINDSFESSLNIKLKTTKSITTDDDENIEMKDATNCNSDENKNDIEYINKYQTIPDDPTDPIEAHPQYLKTPKFLNDFVDTVLLTKKMLSF